MTGFAGDPGSGCSCKRLGSKALSVEKLPIFSRLPHHWIGAGGACEGRVLLRMQNWSTWENPSFRKPPGFPPESQGYWSSLPAQRTCPGLLASPAFPRASASASVQVAGSPFISELWDAAPGPEHREGAWGSGPTLPSAWGSREYWKRGLLVF